MRTVADLREHLGRRFRTHLRRWAGADDLGAEEVYAWPLHPPTEQQTATDPEGVAVWVRQWRDCEERYGVRIERVQRRWGSLGHHLLPHRVVVPNPATTAALAGQAALWERLTAAVGRLRSQWPGADYLGDALSAQARLLATMSDTDLDRLIAVVDWLVTHPDSGLLPRQLPVIGVDTKWYERHRGVVGSVTSAITGSSDLGLVNEAQRFRVRLLDPELGRLTDFTAPVAELDRLTPAIRAVVIVENLAVLAVLPPLKGVVAVHGRGFAVTQLHRIGWVRATPVLYWGDLDSYGFEILGRCRGALPQTRSVLMDRATLARFRERAVPEPRPYRAEIGRLEPEEVATLEIVREGDVRLEQERLHPAYAASALTAALGSTP